jgi:hypothetical protein
MGMKRDMQDQIERYRAFCSSETSVPIFCRDWWLDAVAAQKWGAVLIESEGRVAAAMPYVVGRRFAQPVILQPPLTQFLGPWLAPCAGREQKRLETEKELLQQLFAQLPYTAGFRQTWHRDRTNWLPLHWLGYSQTTRYTYRLEDLTDLEAVWSGFSSNIRREIRKAEGRFGLRLRKSPTIDHLLDLAERTFRRQGRGLPYERSIVQRIEAACRERAQSRILIAEDAQGRAHAGCYLVWDSESAYYLLGGGDPELRNSGAMSLVMWEAIRFSAEVSDSFDFEGSMIESIERFFRAFGALQTPYFAISRSSSCALLLANALSDCARLRAKRR